MKLSTRYYYTSIYMVSKLERVSCSFEQLHLETLNIPCSHSVVLRALQVLPVLENSLLYIKSAIYTKSLNIASLEELGLGRNLLKLWRPCVLRVACPPSCLLSHKSSCCFGSSEDAQIGKRRRLRMDTASL